MPKFTLRTAAIDPPTVVVIKPDGHFFYAPCCSNLETSVIKFEDGKHILREKAKDAGYLLLKDVAKGQELALLEEFFRQDVISRGRMKMPDKMLPKQVLAMRKGAAEQPTFDIAAAKEALKDAEAAPA